MLWVRSSQIAWCIVAICLVSSPSAAADIQVGASLTLRFDPALQDARWAIGSARDDDLGPQKLSGQRVDDLKPGANRLQLSLPEGWIAAHSDEVFLVGGEHRELTVSLRVDLGPAAPNRSLVNARSKADSKAREHRIEEFVEHRWLNGRRHDVFRVEILGEVVFTSDLADLHEREDIIELSIDALRLVVDRPLRLPQTHLEIRSSHIEFTGGGTLSTSPLSETTRAPTGRAGRPGLRAGDILLIADRVTGLDGAAMDLRGGAGQDAGLGADGLAHTAPFIESIESQVSNCETCVARVFEFPWDNPDICPVPDDIRDLITYVNIATSGVLPRCFANCGAIPENGRDARPPGRAGDGGNGGTLTSNLDLSAFALIDGGQAGDPGPPTWHGSPAQAPRQYYVATMTNAGCRFERFQARDGRDAYARPGDSGSSGGFELIEAPIGAWMTDRLDRYCAAQASRQGLVSPYLENRDTALDASTAALVDWLRFRSTQGVAETNQLATSLSSWQDSPSSAEIDLDIRRAARELHIARALVHRQFDIESVDRELLLDELRDLPESLLVESQLAELRTAIDSIRSAITRVEVERRRIDPLIEILAGDENTAEEWHAKARQIRAILHALPRDFSNQTVSSVPSQIWDDLREWTKNQTNFSALEFFETPSVGVNTIQQRLDEIESISLFRPIANELRKLTELKVRVLRDLRTSLARQLKNRYLELSREELTSAVFEKLESSDARSALSLHFVDRARTRLLEQLDHVRAWLDIAHGKAVNLEFDGEEHIQRIVGAIDSSLGKGSLSLFDTDRVASSIQATTDAHWSLIDQRLSLLQNLDSSDLEQERSVQLNTEDSKNLRTRGFVTLDLASYFPLSADRIVGFSTRSTASQDSQITYRVEGRVRLGSGDSQEYIATGETRHVQTFSMKGGQDPGAWLDLAQDVEADHLATRILPLAQLRALTRPGLASELSIEFDGTELTTPFRFDVIVVSENAVSEARFRRGDVDGDGQVVLTDAIYLLKCLFASGACGSCDDAADANDDGALNLSDAIFTLGCLFLGEHCPAVGACGPDENVDQLDCLDLRSCRDSI